MFLHLSNQGDDGGIAGTDISILNSNVLLVGCVTDR